MLEPGPSERESDFSDLEIKTERVLAEDVAAKRKTPAAPEAPVIVPEPVTVTASMTKDQLPGNAMVRVHQPIPATRTVPVVVHNHQPKMPTPIPMPMPLPAAEGPILRASLGYEQSPVIQKVMVPGPLSKKTDQQLSPVPVQLPTPPMKRISSRAVKVIKDIYKEAKEAESPSNSGGKRQSKGGTAEKDVNNWDCPVCKQKLEESVRLRDHLKTHLSDEVS